MNLLRALVMKYMPMSVPNILVFSCAGFQGVSCLHIYRLSKHCHIRRRYYLRL